MEVIHNNIDREAEVMEFMKRFTVRNNRRLANRKRKKVESQQQQEQREFDKERASRERILSAVTSSLKCSDQQGNPSGGGAYRRI